MVFAYTTLCDTFQLRAEFCHLYWYWAVLHFTNSPTEATGTSHGAKSYGAKSMGRRIWPWISFIKFSSFAFYSLFQIKMLSKDLIWRGEIGYSLCIFLTEIRVYITYIKKYDILIVCLSPTQHMLYILHCMLFEAVSSCLPSTDL